VTAAFPPEEYAERLRRLRAAMEAARLDVVFLSSPEALCWLSGFTAAWYQGQSPPVFAPASGIAVHVDRDDWVHFVGAEDEALARDTSVSRDIRTTDVVGELRTWLGRARLGLERQSSRPNRDYGERFEADLVAAGARVSDASPLLRGLRRRKSAAELAHVREAQRIADAGLAALTEVIAPGMTELAAHGELLRALAAEGGENPGIMLPVASGPRSACVHALSSRRRLEPGDLVNVSATGVFHRYHALLGRTLSLGEPSAAVAERCAHMAAGAELVASLLRPGLPVAQLLDAVAGHYRAAGILGDAWWIGGYEVGIAFPPDWVGGFVYQHGDDPGDARFAPGDVAIYEANFHLRGGLATGITTFAVTDERAEFLTRTPFDLVVIG
jgi:Xaa-Pro aminopeptidase